MTADVDLLEDVPPPAAPMDERPPEPALHLWSWRETRADSRDWPLHGLLTATTRQATLDVLEVGVRAAGWLARAQTQRPAAELQDTLARIAGKYGGRSRLTLVRGDR